MILETGNKRVDGCISYLCKRGEKGVKKERECVE